MKRKHEPSPGVVEHACELVRLGGVDIQLDQMARLIGVDGYPHKTAPTEIQQAWMRGRNMPKAVRDRILRPPVPQPRTVRAATVKQRELLKSAGVARRNECRSARFQRTYKWRRKNGFRSLRGYSTFHEWAVRKFIHECLAGPESNYGSCLNPALWLRYQTELFIDRPRTENPRRSIKEI